MAGTIKLRLRDGDRELEIEGDKAEVDHLVAKLWFSSDITPVVNRPETRARSQGKARKPVTSKAASGNAPATSRTFDALSIANQMKEDSGFTNYKEKILHKSDVYRKVAFVAWWTDAELTSGDIKRTLTALSVKITLPSISNCLKKHSDKFINPIGRQMGGKTPTYKMTSSAQTEFDQWLAKSE